MRDTNQKILCEKADAVNREILFQDRCFKDLYKWLIENIPKEMFISHDGPHYANGNLYTSHTLLKRHYRFSCYKVLHNINELSDVEKYLTPFQIVEHNGIMGNWEIGKFFTGLWKMNTKLNRTDLQINKPIYWLPSLSTSLA
ncbi:unnamed protein product [Rhizophagus irregularis]|nr:unnamed protein product [Rhizophagus irregularis]